MCEQLSATVAFIICSFVAGMVESARLPGFSRLLWFACKGNVFLRHMDIPELSVCPIASLELMLHSHRDLTFQSSLYVPLLHMN